LCVSKSMVENVISVEISLWTFIGIWRMIFNQVVDE
jgi:hypothetical protein